MHDMIAEWLGQPVENESIVDDKQLEIALAIEKLSVMPEWAIFMRELERLHSETNQPCEVYAENPEQAFYDAGCRRAITTIKQFADRQIDIVKKYVQEKEEN